MSAVQDKWYRVPEAWLIVVLLAGAVIGSLSLVATAARHPDTLTITPKSIASPLPPSAASAPADGATP
jgi:hypothetical protein